MKKQILGWFAIVMLSATAISATKKSSVITNNGNYAIADTTPHKMHPKRNDTTNRNRMDTSMNYNSDSTMHRDSTHNK